MFGRNKERLAKSAMNVSKRRRRNFRSKWLWYKVRTSFKIWGSQTPGALGSLVWKYIRILKFCLHNCVVY
jgi:hypothetical protein